MGSLSDRTALITGSNKGIGRAIATRFAEEGAKVVITGRDELAAETTAAEIETRCGVRPPVVTGDIADPDFVGALYAETTALLGPIDVLVNNAWGGTRINRIENKSPAMFGAALDIAFYSSLRLMQLAFPSMRERGWGRIVNVGSLNGVNAHMLTGDYNVAKEALRALTRTAAREWFQYGIVANVICPAARVERHDNAWGADADSIAADVGRGLPAGRMGDPSLDIAGVAAFLASDDARFLTGNTLFVDGGAHISGVAWAPVAEEDAGGVPVETAIHLSGRDDS